MDALKKQLAPIKGSITKIHNWYTTSKDILSDIYQYQIKEQQLIAFYNKYENLLEDIAELGDDTLNADCDAMEIKYCTTLAGIRQRIDELKGVASVATPSQAVPSTKLPEISISPFSGNFTEWNAFNELFQNLIVNNSSLTDIQKFIYLKSYLKGEPLELIDTLQLTSDNFQIPLTTLKDRYANEFRIINSHIKKLLDVPIFTKTSASGIRKFITQAKQGIQSIKNLKVPKEEWVDLLLIHIYTQKLDFNTNKAFESERDPKKLPTLPDLFDFLDKRCSVMETVAENTPKQGHVRPGFKATHYSSNTRESGQDSGQIKCFYCNANSHRISQCDKFKRLSPQQRFSIIKEKKLCRNCLSSQHPFENCASERTCLLCNKKHHTLLHIENFQQNRGNYNTQNSYRRPIQNTATGGNGMQSPVRPPGINHQSSEPNLTSPQVPITQGNKPTNDTIPSGSTTTCSAVTKTENEILLATALVTLYSARGERIVARALLDNGSQTSFITEGLARELKCKTYKRNMQITSISEQIMHSHKMTDLKLYSTLTNEKEFSVSCIVLDKITCNLLRIRIDTSLLKIPGDIKLADPRFFESQPIDLLLGMDIYSDLLCSGLKKLGKGLPVFINTYLGWTVSGSVPVATKSAHVTAVDCDDSSAVSLFVKTLTSDERADQLLQKFWSVEEIEDKIPRSNDDDLAEIIFKETTVKLEDGRFQVNLPLKTPEEHLKLDESFYRASKRFYTLENKLHKNENLLTEYKSFIDEYVLLGHAKEVPMSTRNEKLELKYFLPHHCVIREDSLTTKLRVVFDASMKSDTDYSLNDIMLKGTTVQPELFDILCRFRINEFVFTADINKMFRQIKINPSQTFMQNILWRASPTEKLKCLELQTVTYGTNTAPYLSTRCLVELDSTHESTYPLAADALQYQCYIDDILYGCDSLNELQDAHKHLTDLLKSAGMTLHKWCSNSQEFLKQISTNQHQTNYVITSENNTSKVLGISWEPNLDEFAITLPKESFNEIITKRQVLSVIAQIFDPIGLINPFIVIAKILMQKIWLARIDWDDQLNDDLLKEWKTFLKHIPDLKNLTISRYLFTQPRNKVMKIEIHAFSDASIKCYGACVYLRVIYYDNSISCNLITSKSRIAPLKQLTMPRLELCGAVLMTKLAKKILSVFEDKVSLDLVHLWTDSQIVLSWIKGHPSRWSVFVANRVSEIQTLTSQCNWHYVKSANNPADILSRGSMPQELIKSSLWFHGPNFLHAFDLNLEDFDLENEVTDIPEEKKTVLFVQKTEYGLSDFLLKFSCFKKLQRVMAYCLRACLNFKNHKTPSKKLIGPLSIEELQEAEKTIIKTIQNKFFAQEIKELKLSGQVSNKSIKSLSPVLDRFNMLRVGGRLSNAEIAYEHKHPLLLPSKNQIVRLLIHKEHLRLYHAGAQNVLANVRLKYWPIDGLREVKGVIRKCITCFRFRAQPAVQVMAELPKERVTAIRPFINVGIDFGGPFLIKPTKLRPKTFIKCYLAIFVCMTTKAVHLELVSSLTTEEFLQTLRRFIGRRGCPSVVYSDNGTNFQGASNKLKELYNFFGDIRNQEAISNKLMHNEITWKFIPARSPHWGGIWEAAVKGAKHHILRVIGESALTFEEFSTILVEIEAIMNSRPLCPLSSDPNDLSCLTPGHFLIGAPLTSIPDKDTSTVPENRLNRWQRCVQIKQSFWNRWTVEYLNCLQKRAKWITPQKNLQVGDLVLLVDESSPPLKWPLARISEVLPGRDSRVRAAKVQTKQGSFIRSITKLCLLPKNEED